MSCGADRSATATPRCSRTSGRSSSATGSPRCPASRPSTRASRRVPVDADISSLKLPIVGAAPLPPQCAAAFEARTGVALCEGYGLTEGTCASALSWPDAPRPGTVGQRLPYQEARAVAIDEVTGEWTFLPEGEVGTLVLRGPNIFAGYLVGGDSGTAVARRRQGQGRLARHRRPRLRRRGWVHPARRPRQGPDHPRRPQHRSRDDRGCAARAPGGHRRRRRRAARPARRRGARRVRHPRERERPHPRRARSVGSRPRARAGRRAQARRDRRRDPADHGRKAVQARAAPPGGRARGAGRARGDGRGRSGAGRPRRRRGRDSRPELGPRRRRRTDALAIHLDMEADRRRHR